VFNGIFDTNMTDFK